MPRSARKKKGGKGGEGGEEKERSIRRIFYSVNLLCLLNSVGVFDG